MILATRLRYLEFTTNLFYISSIEFNCISDTDCYDKGSCLENGECQCNFGWKEQPDCSSEKIF